MKVLITDKSKDILRKSDISSSLKVPKMTDAEYDDIKYIVEYIGGHWREKFKDFVFDDLSLNVQSKIKNILNCDYITLTDETKFKIDNQFYPTPARIARVMVQTACIKSNELVLEPSAGRGALLDIITTYTKHYRAVEYNKKNVDYLRLHNYRVNYTSFEKYAAKVQTRFDVVVMNPPFGKEMDLRHTALAFNLLKTGGRLIGLVAENSLYYDRKVTHDFMNQIHRLKRMGATPIPHGSFKESGTNVDIVMLELYKSRDSEHIIL